MAINLGGGFHIGSKQPIDDRLIMTKDEMLNVNENTFPNVYMCICSDDGAIYTFNVSNEANAETGKFRIIEGGNGVSVDCYTKSEIDTKLDDYTKTEDLHTVATTGSYNDLLDKPTNYPAGSVEYVNDVVNSYTVEEALNKLIADFYYVESSITSFTASPAAGTYEVGTTISSPTFNWSYDKDIVSQTLTDCPLADETVRTATYDSDITSDKTFTLTANDGRNNVSGSISYKFVYPTYVGIVENGNVDETNILANCTKLIRTKSAYNGKFTANFQTLVFATPTAFGTLSSVINQNNYEVLDAFTKQDMTINGVSYYVYSLENVNITDFSYNLKY